MDYYGPGICFLSPLALIYIITRQVDSYDMTLTFRFFAPEVIISHLCLLSTVITTANVHELIPEISMGPDDEGMNRNATAFIEALAAKSAKTDLEHTWYCIAVSMFHR
jgi:hypothetical protein